MALEEPGLGVKALSGGIQGGTCSPSSGESPEECRLPTEVPTNGVSWFHSQNIFKIHTCCMYQLLFLTADRRPTV